MAGKIVADTLEHSTAGSVSTQYIVSGSAKAFIKVSGAAQTTDKSFNISTRNDLGVGQTEINFTSAMDGVHFCKTALADFSPTVDNGLHAYGSDGQSSGATPTSTKTRVDCLEYNTTTDGDFGYSSILIHGDLA